MPCLARSTATGRDPGTMGRRLAVLLLLGACVAGAHRGACAATSAPRPTRFDQRLAWADSLKLQGRTAEQGALLDSLVNAARSSRDTLAWCRGVLARGRRYIDLGNLDAVESEFSVLANLTARHPNRSLAGNAQVGLGYVDLQRGFLEPAERHYRAALRLVGGGVAPDVELIALTGIANVLDSRGHPQEAADIYRQVIARSRAVGDLRTEAFASNNLGGIEGAQGDPARAVEDYANAIALCRRIGYPLAFPTANYADMLARVGRLEPAAAALESLLVPNAPPASWVQRAIVRGQLAMIWRLQGRTDEAEHVLSDLWASADSMPPALASRVAVRHAHLLTQLGRPRDAATVLRELDIKFHGRLEAREDFEQHLRWAQAEIAMGENAEAVARLRSLRARTPAGLDAEWGRLDLEIALARAHWNLGQLDTALAVARGAAAMWEGRRSLTRDPEWMEVLGGDNGSLATLTASLLLDSRRGGSPDSRAREAFDAVQRFKARALEYRFRLDASESHAVAATLHADQLQQHVLRDGEVLLDYYSSQPDSNLVFAVTRHELRACWLPRWDEGSSAGSPRDFVTSPAGHDGSFREAVLSEGARRVFGDALDLVRSSQRLLIAPSGAAARQPFAALVAEVAADHAIAAAPELDLIPSASWLAERRARVAAVPATVQVVETARVTDGAGRVLPGVAEETEWLRHRYGATGIVHHGERGLAEVTPWLGRGDILHVAAHAAGSVFDPWGSALLLGHGAGEDAWLSARAIAAHHLPARLAVLASCNTTLGAYTANESVFGLSTAFLAAGVPTVLSTQWSVEDRATARFVRAFYGALEQGDTAEHAVRLAQIELASQSATRDPFYWAGFVLAGDPDLRLKLRAR